MIVVDEIDSLIGDTLVGVLRQLRAGYSSRPLNYPQSIILCGVRDIRDYRIHASSEKEPVTGGSCFNVVVESLKVGNFSQEEVNNLYKQHSDATGQLFTEEALKLAFELTNGQPWLVNALAYETCFKNPKGKNTSNPITGDLIHEAKESLIKRRVTHLDQLADKLKEPRVYHVVKPMLLGEQPPHLAQGDIDYVLDLGLLVKTENGFEAANPIYHEVIPRELVSISQALLMSEVKNVWYMRPDGSIHIDKLLTDFQNFFRENSESWVQRFEQYQEAGPQLLLQAYLQRVVNGGGRIDREYGLGRKRTDILLTWPYKEQGHKRLQKAVFELKIQHKSRKETLQKGLEQTKCYLERVGHSEGHLLIFDRDPARSWDEKVFKETHDVGGYSITVWGM